MLTPKELLDDYNFAMREGQAAVFVGAGLSTASGIPDWKGLVTPCAEALGLEIHREANLPELTQYYVNSKGGNRSSLNRILTTACHRRENPTKSHEAIAELPISTIWTSNFDQVMERALEAAHKTFDIRRADADFANYRRGEVLLNKMHGDRERPHEVILTKSDYEKYATTHPIFQNALEGDLTTKTFLFLGFSFTDPNLSSMLAGLRSVLGDSKRAHYAIVRKARLRGELLDEGVSFAKVANQYRYEVRKQELHLQDLLNRFGINTLLVSQHLQVPKILNALKSKRRLETVFVSANSLGGSYSSKKMTEFCQELVAKIVEMDWRLLGDFRTEAGRAILNSALPRIKNDGGSDPMKYLQHSLPDGKPSVNDPKNLGTISVASENQFDQACRLRMVRDSGFVILIGGNGGDDAQIKYDIERAKSEKAVLIPIGVSGEVSREIWANLMADPQAEYKDLDSEKEKKEFLKAFGQLGNPSMKPEELVKAVFKIIDIIGKKVPDISSEEPRPWFRKELLVRLMDEFPTVPQEELEQITDGVVPDEGNGRKTKTNTADPGKSS